MVRTSTSVIQVKITGTNPFPKLLSLASKKTLIQRRGQLLTEIGNMIRTAAIRNAYGPSPSGGQWPRSGKLAQSIKLTVNAAQGRATVFADRRIAPYAAAVEMGQRPHEIPNNPAWGGRGKIHPGAPGKFYLYRAAADVKKQLSQKKRKAVQLAVRDVGLKI